MKQKRRKFSGEFKSKVVLEALKEQDTLEVLAKKYELQPTQISKWKTEALENFKNIFSKNSPRREKQVDTEKLYAQIGQLKVENDFLKKSCYDRFTAKAFDGKTNTSKAFKKKKM